MNISGYIRSLRFYALLNLVALLFVVLAPSLARADLQQAIQADTNTAVLDGAKSLRLVRRVLVYPDPSNALTPASITEKYLSNDRPLALPGSFLSVPARGEAMWLLLPLENRTHETQWALDFGTRLSGRSLQMAELQVMDLATNRILFNQAASAAALGFSFQGVSLSDREKVFITLAPRARHLLLIKLVSSGEIQALTPLRILPAREAGTFYPKVIPGAGLFFSGMILVLALLAVRPMIGFFVGYTLALSALVALPLPLLDVQTVFVRAHFILQIFACLSLVMGVCAVVRLSNLKLPWQGLHGALLAGHVLMGAVVLLAPMGYLNMPLFAFVLPLLATGVGIMLATLMLQEGDRNGFYIVALIAINGVAIWGQGLTAAQILPSGLLAFWVLPASIFVMGPLILVLLHHVNLFAEIVDMGKRRKRSLNDEEQLARLRSAKENFDYNNLLKVIEHERRQLADARAREQLRTDEMRKAKEQADEANRAKSAFLAVISHEIRTPMTGIMGMVKLLVDSTLNKAQHEFVMTIKESGNAMMSLLNDILDFEKIESGKMQLESLDFDLHRLVSSVATLMNGHALTKGIQLKVKLDTSVPQYVVGDVTRLRQVLLNLVGNAIKFTKTGSVTIKLSATQDETGGTEKPVYQVYFAVIDTGIGISSEAQKNIFNPFSQADKTIARKFGGSGLGLAISKRLIEAMGSQINIQSREGEGTTFFFSLNMKEGDSSIVDETLAKSAAAKASTYSPGDLAALPKLRIMVVEDNAITQKVIRTMVEQGGHTVLVCASGEEALPYLQMGERFDLILSDIQMQGQSGYDFTRQVRRLEAPTGRSTPIYALTGNVDSSDIEACLQAGMNGHIAKPIDPNLLADLLVTIAEARENSKTEPREQGAPRAPASSKTPAWSGSLTQAVDPELELIGTLRESLGDEQIKQLLEGLYEKAEEIISALTGQTEINLDLTRTRAHELKGMCGNFGMMTLSDLAKQIEKQAKEGIHENIIDLINALPSTYREGRQKIESWMAK